jgi:peptidoglycan/LPS O-acetylase OafA/YrhL
MYTNFLLEEKKEESDHIFVKLKKAMQRNRILQWSIELSGVFLGTFICFIPRTGQNEHNWPQLAHSLYLTYGKTGFVVAVSLIVLPSLLGMNSFVRFILDTKLFNFIGKVSYCTYLVHLIFITYWMYAQFTNFYFGPIATYVIFLTTSIASIFFGFILSILVEIPFAKFQKQLMSKLLHKKEKVKHHKEENKQ